ncbi:ferric reductase-like transmembrane domain-containing protein [Amycolatopsis sp. CA-126428]|uniref:ferric reductase-like transmembrane domain-containing protein n=1 Tax=Amycolatopsis sp. CA-126428 TaxID=2073158 RepID=UPI000CD20C95|nr:ferric reductase-like transmembrane domain-containing protein [Amycolatopsis sp. CA-126428]
MVETWHDATIFLTQQFQPKTDPAARNLAAFAARTSYAATMLTLTWGVLTATGWIRSVTGRKGLRSTHMVLATATIIFGLVHALGFTYLTVAPYSFAYMFVPFGSGQEGRHIAGIVGFEVMFAIFLTAGLQRFTSYRRWLWLHRCAYPAVALIAIHSWFGAIANGHLSVTWLAGITLLVPAVTVSMLRFMPARTLERIGLVEEQVA